ncbi:DUF2243 domain-containing protein [Actinoplanes philippinensis]|uniref:DUF2243 domain-containing protein n=1 Tax=Actinoplanes philippinensis TaxID=35752 RepID=UPI0034069881
MEDTAVRLPGIVLGIGMGGFADGILLHQVLQWHHLLTSEYPADTVDGLRMNTLGDGLFHTVTWLAVLAGLGLLHSRIGAVPGRVWRSRELWGWMLVGWGLFNLVEGLVDHHLLGIHHVRGGPYQLWWDLGFLILGLVLAGGGWLLQRGARVAR